MIVRFSSTSRSCGTGRAVAASYVHRSFGLPSLPGAGHPNMVPHAVSLCAASSPLSRATGSAQQLQLELLLSRSPAFIAATTAAHGR